MESKTLEDFQKITGLSREKAEECFNTYYKCYGASLASFAQSYKGIPKSFYENSDSPAKNVEGINKELKEIYKKAREEKKKMSAKSDKEVWMQLGKTLTSSAPSAAKMAFAFRSFSSTAGLQGSSSTPDPAVEKKTLPSPFQGFNFSESSNTKTSASPLSFGTAMPSSTGSAAPFFGFGATPSATPSSSAQISFGSGFGFAPAATAEKDTTDQKKTHKFCDPKHNVGPLLEIPGFWEEEVEAGASLFNLDGGYLVRNKGKLGGMMKKWVSRASFYKKPVKYVEMEDRDEETVRVIIKDAERSFLTPTYREKLIMFLHAMFVEFGCYGQAMSYLAGLCMLALNEEETAAVLRFVSQEYIKGHWAAEAVGFATSAWVVEYFMQKVCPAVARRLDELKFWPDTYLQKILTGLCIHVLSFNELFEFLNAFMEGGLKYLICFCLAVIEHFQSSLLKIKSTTEANTLYEIMALNSRVCHVTDVRAILQRAQTIDLGDDGTAIAEIRAKVYDEKVGPRLKRAPKVDTFEPCEICEKNRPKWYSDDLGAVCNECKNKHPDVVFEAY